MRVRKTVDCVGSAGGTLQVNAAVIKRKREERIKTNRRNKRKKKKEDYTLTDMFCTAVHFRTLQ